MNPPLRNSALAAVFGLTLVACSSNPASKATEASTTPVASTSPAGNQQMMDHSQMGGMFQTGGMGGGMTSMDLGPADAQYDLRFIDAMTPHHQGATEMAQDALKKSQRPEIKQLVRNIIADQNREINQMKQWRQAWYPKASNTPVAYDAQTGRSMAMSQSQMQGMMMNGDLGPANAQYDLRFINMMIPHHQGAIVMAKDALNKSRRPEIKRLAQSIITSQQQEIDQMKQWRQAWYGQ